MSDWVRVYSTGVDYLADLLMQVLYDNNIDSVLINKKDTAYLFGAVEVYVNLDNSDKARLIVEEFEKNTGSE